jgi:hypothetical protein
MSNSSFTPFSMMGKDQKAKIDAAIDQSLAVMETILDAPMAAKENLMKTDFKVANSTLGFVGRILQAESAMVQAFTVLADRAGKSKDFKKMISDNLPMIQLSESAIRKPVKL